MPQGPIAMTVKGIKVFDPRDGQMKWSDNPALILRDLMLRLFPTVGFADGTIGAVADYCDTERMSMSAFITRRGASAETYSKIPGA
jgi:hypothetical protein